MAVGGKVREQKEFSLKVGVGEFEVVAFNPDREELGILQNRTIDKDIEYIGSKNIDGEEVRTLRIDAYLKQVGEDYLTKVSFFLKDRVRKNKSGDKTQYIDNTGTCTWAEGEGALADWFTKRDYREAKEGEEELYEFLKNWLNKLDFKDLATELKLDLKLLFKGNMKELTSEVGGAYSTSLVILNTIRSVTENEGTEEESIKQYPGVYNRAFLPGWQLKYFRNKKFTEEELERLRNKKAKELKPYERFAAKVSDPNYGCSEFWILDLLTDYESVKDKDFSAEAKVLDPTDSDI